MLSLWENVGEGVRVVRLTTPGEVEALVQLFEGVAVSEGWKPEAALRSWRDRSVYFALEVQGELAGGLQLVLQDEAGAFPYQTIWPEVPLFAPGHQAHVALLAVRAPFRGRTLLFWRLVIELWRYCVGEELASLSIEVTPRVLPLYWRLGWPLQVQGELREHWGEPCYLALLGVPEVAEALLRRAAHSAYYREIISQAFRIDLARVLPPGKVGETSRSAPLSVAAS